MNKLILYFCVFLLMFGIHGCITCDDCSVIPPAKKLLITNNSGSTNLLFGASAIYSLDSVNITNASGIDVPFSRNNSSQTLDFDFDKSTTTYILKLNSFDSDTIEFEYGKDKHVDCCNEFDVTKKTFINSVLVNNTDEINIKKP